MTSATSRTRTCDPSGAALQNDVAELVPAVAAFGGAKKYLAGFGLDAAARELDRGGANAGGDFIERQSVLAELRLRDLDADLEWANAGELDIGDARVAQELAAAVLRDRA